MRLSSHRLAVLALAAPLLAGDPASGAEASAWSAGHHARARLVQGIGAGDVREAGVEIALDPGFKTYWRHPGDSGLPPAFDWAGSTNVASVEVLWPAPRRFEDAGGTSYGYPSGVTLPLKVRASDPAKPSALALSLQYGVCKDICIPVQARLALSLPPRSSGRHAALAAAMERVPTPRPLGAEGNLAVVAATPAPGGAKPALTVTVRAPAGEAELFVEGPDGWFLAADAPSEPVPGRAGERRFQVLVHDRPKDAAGRVPLTLTLVAGERAVETQAALDGAELSR